jgi:putative NADH-flavin reductase
MSLTSTPSTSGKKLFLVLGATGCTGKHFLTHALSDGHRIRALVRSPDKLPPSSSNNPNLEIIKGSITSPDINTDTLVSGVDAIICMLGDKNLQATSKINLTFIQQLVPSMRKAGVKHLLYQAGGLSKPYKGNLPPLLWVLRNTLARGFNGQHLDNEAVMEYLEVEARDIDWVVHRAGIGGDGVSKGRLERSNTQFSVGTFRDCAEYNYRLVFDREAVHTSDFSHYE